MAPVRPRRPLGAAPTLVSARVQQESRPRNGRGKSGHIAKHDFDDVTDSIGGILRTAATTQPPIDEQLQQIEGQRPEKQDGHQSVRAVSKNMPEIPVLDPLIEAGILDVPTSPDDL